MSRANTLTEIWNTYNKNVLSESVPGTKAEKFGTKPGKGPVTPNNKSNKKFQNEDSSGPANADGYKEPIDPKTAKEDNAYEPNKYSSEDFNKKDKKLRKKVKESINNYMKSTFDKLFESVMSDEEAQELEALGVETDDATETEGGDVTITLDRDMAKQLCDLLQAAMGEEDDDAEAEDMEHEDYEEMEEHEDAEHADDEEDEEVAAEAVDAEDLGHSLVNQKSGSPTPVTGGSNVVKSTVSSKAKKGKGGKNVKPSITSASTGEEGHALVNQRKGNPTPVTAGSNKTSNLQAGQDFYQDN